MKIQVYALKNPITKDIGYVGMTTINYISRYGSHLSSAYNPNSREYSSPKYLWFRSVVDTTGKFPEVDLLEDCDVESLQEAYLLESIHTQRLSNIHTLYNKDNRYTTVKIYQHNFDGILIKVWDSVIDIIVSKVLEKKDIGNLMQCINNERKSLKGSMWSLHSSPYINKKVKCLPKYEIAKSTKKVYMYNIDGEFIQEFNSAREAVGYNYKNISQVCIGEKLTHKERRFSFEKVPHLPPLRCRKKNDMSKLNKPLLCFDMNMNFIKEYKSFKDVRDNTNLIVDSGSLSRAARGLHKSYLGFIWRYK